MKVDSLCTACESELDLSSASLSASYYYDSLPYADAPPYQDPGCDPGGRVCLEEADPRGEAGDRADLR